MVFIEKIYQHLIFHVVCRRVCSLDLIDINCTKQLSEHGPVSAFDLESFESQKPPIMMSSLASLH